MKYRYKYHLYDANSKLYYSSHYSYETREFAERLGLNHLTCFQLGGNLIGGYIEWEEITINTD